MTGRPVEMVDGGGGEAARVEAGVPAARRSEPEETAGLREAMGGAEAAPHVGKVHVRALRRAGVRPAHYLELMKAGNEARHEGVI